MTLLATSAPNLFSMNRNTAGYYNSDAAQDCSGVVRELGINETLREIRDKLLEGHPHARTRTPDEFPDIFNTPFDGSDEGGPIYVVAEGEPEYFPCSGGGERSVCVGGGKVVRVKRDIDLETGERALVMEVIGPADPGTPGNCANLDIHEILINEHSRIRFIGPLSDQILATRFRNQMGILFDRMANPAMGPNPVPNRFFGMNCLTNG